MAYYDALKTKWATLSGTTDEKLAAVNALTVAGPDRAVPVAEVSTLLWRLGAWPAIKAATSTSPGAAAAVAFCADIRVVTMDMSVPIVGQMLADMVGRSVISQATADAVVALKATTQPWWQSAGYPSPFNNADISAAGLS